MNHWTSRSLFSVSVIGIVTFFLINTFALNPLARMVPLAVVIPTWILALAQVRLDLRETGQNVTNEKTLFGASDEYRRKVSRHSSTGETLNRMQRSSIGAAWVLMMFGLVYLFGLLPAAPLYTFIYVRLRGKREWPLSAAIAAGVWLLSYLLLMVLSDGSPYRGKLALLFTALIQP